MTPTPASGFDPAALKAARLAAGLSQAELAQRMGLKAVVSISRWESGSRQPQIGSVVALAEQLGVPVSQLTREPVSLSDFRVRAGLSQRQVAEHLGVTAQRYAQLEGGVESGRARLRYDQALQLGELFGIDQNTLARTVGRQA